MVLSPTIALLSVLLAHVILQASCQAGYGHHQEPAPTTKTGKVVTGPHFTAPLTNLTVALGRDATFDCQVAKLGGYRVGWVKADTKAIQAIHDHVITHNPRVSVSHANHNNWKLHIRSVKEEDGGQYMCQINTDPMQSQMGSLEVVVPPDFIQEETSGDVAVPENGMVMLNCKASGHPPPHIQWKREDGKEIIIREPTGHRTHVSSYQGETLKLSKVTRAEMGAYLCIASNGIPPTVSKRIIVNVHFHPVIHVPNQLVGAPIGTDVTLECQIEAFPRSINYWVRETGDMVVSSVKFDMQAKNHGLFEVRMTLLIRNLKKEDLGSYKCIAKNSLGDVESNIRVYEIPGPTHNYHPDEEDYNDQFGSAERDQDYELNNNVERDRLSYNGVLATPRNSHTYHENHVPVDAAMSSGFEPLVPSAFLFAVILLLVTLHN